MPHLPQIQTLLLASLIFALGVPAPGGEPEEQAARRWLNEHVIAVADDGRAIEPFDYFSGPTIPLGVVHLHPGKSTHLQISARSRGYGQALDHTGLSSPRTRALTGLNILLFRDVVIPQMLDTAQASRNPIVLFIHGGMNNRDEAIQHAWTYGHLMETEGVYPIFVCWESSMGSSYWEHLAGIRNGTNVAKDNPAWPLLTGPIYLASDVATSVARFPRTMVDLGRSLLRAHASEGFGDVQDSVVRYDSLRRASGVELNAEERKERTRFEKAINRHRPAGDTVQIDDIARGHTELWRRLQAEPGHAGWHPIEATHGGDDRNLLDTSARTAVGAVTLPPKLLVLAGFAGAGIDMWDVMSRRTEVMYHDENSIRPAVGNAHFHPNARHYSEADHDVANSESTGIGAMGVFFRILEDRQRRGQCRDITLVGHSMGAMVINCGLREFPHVACTRVVYMAAAGSVRDIVGGTITYLNQHAQTQLYSMSLHPRAEDRERPLGEDGPLEIIKSELVPRGSLLVWIDEFLGHPRNFTDRTFGHFENALLASRMFPPRLQRQLHLVALSVGPGGGALQHHGDFSNYRFWNPRFYQLPGNERRDGWLVGREENKQLQTRFGTPTRPGTDLTTPAPAAARTLAKTTPARPSPPLKKSKTAAERTIASTSSN